jgi:hypothetical protein
MYVSYADLRRPRSPVVAMAPEARAMLARCGAARSPIWLPPSYSSSLSVARAPIVRPPWPGSAPGSMAARAGIARNGGWIHPGSPMRPGLGQATISSPQSIASIASTGASVTTSLLIALGTAPTIIGPIVAGVIAVANLLVGVFKGCGSTCTEASDIANQVEPVLQQNLANYLAAPVHYASLQAAALNNFTTAWSALTQACGNPQLLSAGTNCISERQQGACSYKTTPGGWQQTNGTWTYVYPGANGSGSTCWNWFIGYHDPIANDPTVVADPSPASTAVSGALTDIGLSPSTTVFGVPLSSLALPALALVAVLLLMD